MLASSTSESWLCAENPGLMADNIRGVQDRLLNGIPKSQDCRPIFIPEVHVLEPARCDLIAAHTLDVDEVCLFELRS